MQFAKSILHFLFIGLITSSCYPQGPTEVDDFDVVYTTHDPSYDFRNNYSYAMPDSVMIGYEVKNGETIPKFMNPNSNAKIIEAIENNMQAYGWNRVEKNQNPDVYLFPAGMTNNLYFYNYWYDYWGWNDWYYPPYFDITTYHTGSFIIVMASENQAAPIKQTEANWISVSNGILNDGKDVSYVVSAINQSFEQSEDYLNKFK